MLTIPVFLAVTAAYIVKGMCGFANTLVFGTLAGFFTDNVNISPVDLLLGYPSNLWIAWTERKGIRPKIWASAHTAILPMASCSWFAGRNRAFFLSAIEKIRS